MLRRNGKPRSCEPCRISKIRCDHATPTCEKCRTRGITDKCFYHPSPLTKPPGVPRKKPEPRRARVVEPRHSEARDHGDPRPLSLSPSALRNDIANIASSPVVGVWPTPPDSATRMTQGACDSGRSFYLGSTSYASVFAADRQLPDSMHEQPPEKPSATPSAASSILGGTRHCRMSMGNSIVTKLQPFSFFESSVEWYFVVFQASALVGPLVTSALPQLRKDLTELASMSDDPYAAYAQITKNSAQPLKVPSTMKASEFHTLFTGRNLRWETLGLVMILAASHAQFTSPDDPIFTLENGSRIDKDVFIEDMIHASNDCINLCQVHGTVNDIMVWLLYNNMMVKSNFYGDNYHGVWRRMGDCISALYAEGIHCEEACDEPFFLRESRRRMYGAAYRSDKTLATFFGRPPMMNGRYSDRKPPLDIDDYVVVSDDPEVIKEALLKLNADGWDTEPKIRPASWIRLRKQMSLSKERFLEISLAGQTIPNIEQEIEAVQLEHGRCWEMQPAHLRYDLYDEFTCWTTFGPQIALRMISAYLEHLHMEFQIQRLLLRHTHTALPVLLEKSMTLLATVLVFNKRRNQQYNVQRHFATLVLCYCLPSAGVLALELRRCTLENAPLPSTVSRADIIRNLSILTSCIDWAVMPGDGNHRLCSELNKMLALVLDEVLNYQPAMNDTLGNEHRDAMVGVGPGFFDIPMVDGMEPIPTESEDFLNWLDNANWNNTYHF